MNTPAHAMINLAILGRKDGPKLQGAVIAGALLPDLPMFLFYFVEKVWNGSAEHIIWSQNYHLDSWQNFFDIFNSLPLIGLGLALSVIRKSKAGMLFFFSMILHVCGDFFVHHDDAHRYFFPFSDWRFISPISYWDPRYHGTVLSVIEITAVILCAAILLRSAQQSASKWLVGLIAASYAVYITYVLLVWV